jgi:hypothetical protein
MEDMMLAGDRGLVTVRLVPSLTVGHLGETEMTKQIGNIAIFIDFNVNTYTGREYVDHASVQIRDENFGLIENCGLSSVVNSESDLWDHVVLTVERAVENGYDIDKPQVTVYRSHKSCLDVDYYDTIGQRL